MQKCFEWIRHLPTSVIHWQNVEHSYYAKKIYSYHAFKQQLCKVVTLKNLFIYKSYIEIKI